MARSYLVALLVLLLVGCAYPKPQLDRGGLPVLGPIVLGEERRPVTGDCRQIFMYAGTCDLLFEDLKGRRVDGHRLRSELDQKASALRPLANWVRPVELGRDSELPYDLYLLTISPEIVLAVPRGSERRKNCPSVYQDGCIQSRSFGGSSYWYRQKPKVHPGSFWFNQATPSPQWIESSASDVVISIDRAVVRLTRTQDEWRVVRER
jgi:hypothetical protein